MASELLERIQADLKTTMKARNDKVRLSTLRLISAAIKDKDIAARAEDRCGGLSNEEIEAILTKMVKQREESAKTYEDAGRIELAEQEREELAVIIGYLPKQLTEDEIVEAVDAVIGDVGAAGLKDMGKCMAALKEQYQGRMDFSKANQTVKARLSAS